MKTNKTLTPEQLLRSVLKYGVTMTHNGSSFVITSSEVQASGKTIEEVVSLFEYRRSL